MSTRKAGIREWPVRERPRERLRDVGAAALTVRELLAILVGSGPTGQTAVDVAGAIFQEAGGSLRRLSTLPAAELERLPGVGSAVTARVAAALELGRRLAREGPEDRPRIEGPRDVYERCGPSMRDLQHEEFRVLLLNAQHEVIRELTVTSGVLDGSVIHPREVFKQAIAWMAAAVLLVHNHPSGNPTPSAEDRAVTNQIAGAGELVGIPVLDHVVIGDGRYISFVESGLLGGEG